jgi:fructosamine-3-kinase
MNLDAELRAAIAATVGAATGTPFTVESAQPAGGGCIHQAWTVEGGGRRYFVKTNGRAAAAMFAAEADGLDALAAAGAIRVPGKVGAGRTVSAPESIPTFGEGSSERSEGEAQQPEPKVGAGETVDRAFLVLEHLELRSLDRAGGAALGTALAALHRPADPDVPYGWPRDNYIGATPQANQSHRTWAGFLADERLRPQLRRAAARGMERSLCAQGEKLAERLAAFFVDYRPQPSLLHGDLWSGNAAQLADGTPVVFDPAVYRGDREADLAMAELFGGFPESFYAAYRLAWPLDAGYETRKTLYNLYHILNHYNMFGGGYLGQARRMIEKLSAELRC